MKKNKELFSNIIGYDNVKKELRIVIDMLNNDEKYKKMGCTNVHGLLLFGPPGTGKTSMSKEILDNVNRKVFTIRKIKSDGDFMEYMNDIFKKAKENQPSIILLDGTLSETTFEYVLVLILPPLSNVLTSLLASAIS